MQARFRDRLQQEWDQRREKNSRFSLRAFAALLGADHSTLSQVLRSRRRVPASRLRSWARKLGLGPEETAAYIAAEHLPDPVTASRESQLRHWTAEAAAILTERAHWEIFRLCQTPEFRADSRWIAERTGSTVDAINIALTRLLRLRLLETSAGGAWIPTAGRPVATEREFRALALARVREKAATFNVQLPRELRRP